MGLEGDATDDCNWLAALGNDAQGISDYVDVMKSIRKCDAQDLEYDEDAECDGELIDLDPPSGEPSVTSRAKRIFYAVFSLGQHIASRPAQPHTNL